MIIFAIGGCMNGNTFVKHKSVSANAAEKKASL